MDSIATAMEQLSHYTTANGLASDSIYCILEDKHGNFWFSGPSGVMLLNRDELDAQASEQGAASFPAHLPSR